MPPDHNIFEELNVYQWVWCAEMIQKDKKEKYDQMRDLLEYQISFASPESHQAIKEVIQERKGSGRKISVSKEDFNQVIERQFGRGLEKQEMLDDVNFIPEK